MLQYLGSLGLYPQVEVEVKSIAPFGGPILVMVAGEEKSLGKELTEKILVQKLPISSTANSESKHAGV